MSTPPEEGAAAPGENAASELPDWAATRDASWYSRPDVRNGKVVHMAGHTIREGIASRCCRSVLDDDTKWRPDDVPEGLRCRRNGCRQAWLTPTDTPGNEAGK